MKVEKHHTALTVGSGDLEVFATPIMIAIMENAAMNTAAGLIDSDSTTVGTMINVSHTRATKLGGEVRAEATLQEQDGRRMIFEVVAYDQRGEIGRGVHERFVINREKFLAKL